MKRVLYIFLGILLGIFISIFAHALIESIILWQAARENIAIKWTELFGQKFCALPMWLIILLPVFGIIFGIFLGNYLYNRSKK